MMRTLVLTVAAAVVVALMAFAAVAGREARAQGIGISGDWGVEFVRVPLKPPLVQSFCQAWIVQEQSSLSGAMACYGEGGAHRLTGEIDEDGMFTLSGTLGMHQFTVEGTASTSLNGTLPGGLFHADPNGSLWGDADCSGGASSRDALLVLQLGARLLSTAPWCFERADGNVSGGVDAVDAALILQTEAGLIARLPVL